MSQTNDPRRLVERLRAHRAALQSHIGSDSQFRPLSSDVRTMELLDDAIAALASPSAGGVTGASETLEDLSVICRLCDTLVAGEEAGTRVKWVECQSCRAATDEQPPASDAVAPTLETCRCKWETAPLGMSYMETTDCPIHAAAEPSRTAEALRELQSRLDDAWSASGEYTDDDIDVLRALAGEAAIAIGDYAATLRGSVRAAAAEPAPMGTRAMDLLREYLAAQDAANAESVRAEQPGARAWSSEYAVALIHKIEEVRAFLASPTAAGGVTGAEPSFGAALREIRVARGMSLREAANLFGITPAKLRIVERAAAAEQPRTVEREPTTCACGHLAKHHDSDGQCVVLHCGCFDFAAAPEGSPAPEPQEGDWLHVRQHFDGATRKVRTWIDGVEWVDNGQVVDAPEPRTPSERETLADRLEHMAGARIDWQATETVAALLREAAAALRAAPSAPTREQVEALKRRHVEVEYDSIVEQEQDEEFNFIVSAHNDAIDRVLALYGESAPQGKT